jgi:hypothetical protein
MLRKFLLTFALTFLLGFSQQSSLHHALTHLADFGTETQQDQVPQHASHCDHCVSIGHLAQGLGIHYEFDFTQDSDFVFLTEDTQPESDVLELAYAARAPPHFI